MSVTQWRKLWGFVWEFTNVFSNKEQELNKNVLPCLLDILSVFVWCILAVSARFQWVLGSLFSKTANLHLNRAYNLLHCVTLIVTLQLQRDVTKVKQRSYKPS